jgi:hypothetical protein
MISLVSFSSFSDRRRFGVVMLCALGGLSLLASACSSSPSRAAAPTATTSLPTPEITTPTVTVDGRTFPVPNDGGTKPIVSAVDTSGQVVLTDKGFLPQHEIANLNQTITWTNLSSHPVTISFSHMPGTRPHQLQVGGTFTFSSGTLINFEYLSSSGFHGTVSIGAFVGS